MFEPGRSVFFVVVDLVAIRAKYNALPNFHQDGFSRPSTARHVTYVKQFT
jgi:hypothetical protein